MHPQAYRSLAAIEPSGWYYQVCARCMLRLIERYVPPRSGELQILDVGCGTGGTSSALSRIGHVQGIEPSLLAIELLRSRYPRLDVAHGSLDDLASLLPAASFDLATIMGVLYHRRVADPALALDQVCRMLLPGGWLVWNEGVYPLLARSHDALVESGRRFRPRQMHRLLESAGLRVRFGSHLLAWGFPVGVALAAAHRMKRWARGCENFAGQASDDRPLPRLFNATLREITYYEWACSLRHVKLPFGVSYLMIAQKAA